MQHEIEYRGVGPGGAVDFEIALAAVLARLCQIPDNGGVNEQLPQESTPCASTPMSNPSPALSARS